MSDGGEGRDWWVLKDQLKEDFELEIQESGFDFP
jgi:hypothetical protein